MGTRTAQTSGRLTLRVRLGAIFLLGSAIVSVVSAKVFAAERPAKPEPAIPVRYTDVRESAKITFQQDSTQTEE